MISVLIAAIPNLLRDGLELMLERSDGIKLVGLADTADSLLVCCHEKKPDVILLGLENNGASKLDIINSIRATCESKIILLISSLNDYKKNPTIREVDGYILEDRKCNLEHIIKTLASGMSIIPHEIYNNLISEVYNNSFFHHQDTFESLTNAEQEIVRLVTLGRSNKEIASTIYISEGTVRNRLTIIYKKLGVKDRVQLAVTAVQSGYVDTFKENISK